jgi:hypothetical protein
MSGFHLQVGDNIRAIKKWHDRKHAGPWHECCWEPCQDTEEEFRRRWS